MSYMNVRWEVEGNLVFLSAGPSTIIRSQVIAKCFRRAGVEEVQSVNYSDGTYVIGVIAVPKDCENPTYFAEDFAEDLKFDINKMRDTVRRMVATRTRNKAA